MCQELFLLALSVFGSAFFVVLREVEVDNLVLKRVPWPIIGVMLTFYRFCAHSGSPHKKPSAVFR